MGLKIFIGGTVFLSFFFVSSQQFASFHYYSRLSQSCLQASGEKRRKQWNLVLVTLCFNESLKTRYLNSSWRSPKFISWKFSFASQVSTWSQNPVFLLFFRSPSGLATTISSFLRASRSSLDIEAIFFAKKSNFFPISGF